MKKITIIAALLLTLACFCSCTAKTSQPETTTAIPDTQTIVPDETTKTEALSDGELLAQKFRNGEWSGNESSINGKTYAVYDRTVYIVDEYGNHGEVAARIDVPSGIAGRQLLASSSGTYIYQDGKITLYKFFIEEVTFDTFLTEDIDYGNVRCYDSGVFIIHHGTTVCIINPYENKLIDKLSNVSDTIEGDDCVKIALNGKNYKICADGKMAELESSYIKFPNENGLGERGKYATEIGRTIYVGGYVDDGNYIDLFDNGDGKSYTMVYHNIDKLDVETVISTHVLDAEYETGRVIYYDGEAVYELPIRTMEPKKISDGKIVCLLDTWTEDDGVSVIR